MTYANQRKLFAKKLPEMADIVLSKRNCYRKICDAIVDKGLQKKAREVVLNANISEWAYKWAYLIGDRDIMRERVIDSEWAYRWAYLIGDRGIMRERVIDKKWMNAWAQNIDIAPTKSKEIK